MFYSIKNYNLKYLFLANNQFKEIFPDIIHLLALKHLSLDNNQITDFKESMFNYLHPNQKFFIGICNNPLKQNKNIGDIFEVQGKSRSKEKNDDRQIGRTSTDGSDNEEQEADAKSKTLYPLLLKNSNHN